MEAIAARFAIRIEAESGTAAWRISVKSDSSSYDIYHPSGCLLRMNSADIMLAARKASSQLATLNKCKCGTRLTNQENVLYIK
ncbi:hypothetical protein GCM10022405_34130 [Gibbsiella dentisursi]|uniref:Uncharacterized protein n=1 Tax=Gibbsiella dentisursi TaxID=796890 RepID=A0ABP7LU52_9GAMM